MISSYEQNNYGAIFKTTIKSFKPAMCVELGVLGGYSTRNILEGLIGNNYGYLESYDLFEDYEFKHSNYHQIMSMPEFQNSRIKLFKQDAFTVHNKYANNTIDFLHVDLSNTGETLKLIMNFWDAKMSYGGIICFEGGSEERDNVPWMKKYNKPKIKPELETNSTIREKYVFATYLQYPSLTILLKKR